MASQSSVHILNDITVCISVMVNVIEIMLLPRLTHSHQNLIGMSRGESLLCSVLPHAKRAEGVSHCMSNNYGLRNRCVGRGCVHP